MMTPQSWCAITLLQACMQAHVWTCCCTFCNLAPGTVVWPWPPCKCLHPGRLLPEDCSTLCWRAGVCVAGWCVAGHQEPPPEEPSALHAPLHHSRSGFRSQGRWPTPASVPAAPQARPALPHPTMTLPLQPGRRKNFNQTIHRVLQQANDATMTHLVGTLGVTCSRVPVLSASPQRASPGQGTPLSLV